MLVRREGIPGKSTPPGILTKLKDTIVGKIIRDIEKLEDPLIIDLGFMLLTLGEETMLEINKGLETIISLARKDKNTHDVTFGIGSNNTGLTIHCNYDCADIASQRLKTHCEMRKYAEKANTWFGICIHPNDGSIKFALKLNYLWEASNEMDDIIKYLPKNPKKINFSEPKKRKK